MIIRKMTENNVIETKEISSICFNFPYDKKGKSSEELLKELKEAPVGKDDYYLLDKWAAYTDDNKMMSCLSTIPFTVYYEGNLMKSIGIGNVCTYPHYRRKGAVREIFNHALPDMYKNGIDFSYLYPFSEVFYGNFGYQRSCTSIRWKFDLAMIPDYRYLGTFHLYENNEDMKDFIIAYKNFGSKFNMMIARDSFDWDKLKNAKSYENNNYAYLYKDENGLPKGYMIFKKECTDNETFLHCSDIAFEDFTTLKALMSFARSYAADFKSICFNAPSCYSLEYFCKDYSQSSSSMNMVSTGMVRVVNVANVLNKSKYQGSGSLSIQVTDQQIEDNNGIFTVTYEEGKAVQIVKSDLESKEADIECTINFFSGAIIGNYDVSDFEYKEGHKINCDVHKLRGVFYKKPCWINNYF